MSSEKEHSIRGNYRHEQTNICERNTSDKKIDIKMVQANSRAFVVIVIVIIVIIIVLAILVALFVEPSSGSDGTGGTGDCNTLGPPFNITAQAQGLTQMRITWDPVPGATRYRVFLGTVPGFTKSNALSTELTDLTLVVIGGLVAGRSYYIKIETLNACNGVGELSQEISAFIGFPSEFKIINRNQQSLVFGTNGGSMTVAQLEPDCGAGDDCVWTYDLATKTVRPKLFPTRCLTSVDDNPNPDKLMLEVCDPEPNALQAVQQWEYDEDLGSFCHPLPSEGFSCVKVDGLILPGQDLIIQNYDTTNEMKWDLLAV